MSLGGVAPAGITAVFASASASYTEASGLRIRLVAIVLASKATWRFAVLVVKGLPMGAMLPPDLTPNWME